ncbi:peptide chain release factor 1 [Candidatus Gromoviella agglomerans]|uniref:peptide chain release factor 1 n=1 Tax=Candidatus Gromoviella agglomerans TaxID=2806609 RepID=UPI001E36030B|nr:peptide chain release factor 1 [Candidatus Gromoviella agglomerans]UFX98215.1 Peptide chain release factor 1 [Candidatus Gromoviella agglomerans]
MSKLEFEKKLSTLLQKFQSIEESLSSETLTSTEIVKLSKEHASMIEIVEKIKQREEHSKSFDYMTAELLSCKDLEMIDFIKDEIINLKKSIQQLENDIKFLLIPVDEDDEKNALLEIRAGTGGEEASLFANNLFNMYIGYINRMGWTYNIISLSNTDLGGIKEVVISIKGTNVFSKLKFESGVHRVQRVPLTESSGRVHTSTATVAVLAEIEDVDIQIADSDIRIDVFRSSGPGGQSVNTTDSAVRITHIPSGIVVSQQDEKSQHKNKAKAMKILRARLYDYEKMLQDKERSMNRKSQVGTGDRSERIRTYNYHDNRITDHRINFTLHKLEKVLTGESLHEIIDELLATDKINKMSAIDE